MQPTHDELKAAGVQAIPRATGDSYRVRWGPANKRQSATFTDPAAALAFAATVRPQTAEIASPPGVEARRGKRRTAVRVRWGPANARRSATFHDPADAKAFRDVIKVKAHDGTLAELNAGLMSLTAFMEDTWWPWAQHHYDERSQRKYESLWRNHIQPALGHYPLRTLTPGLVEDFATAMANANVGPAARRDALALLQRMLNRAVLRGERTSNPVPFVKKPPAKRQRAIVALAPERVETIRGWLEVRERFGSAVLVSLLAYAGLRPEEALALVWGNVRERTLLIDLKNVDGNLIDGQKVTGKPPRTIDLLESLAHDLRGWRLRQGRPASNTLVIARADGEPWREHDYRNWRRRVFQPAAHAAGASKKPYDLRHSYASLRIHEGHMDIAVLARQMGHSVATLLDKYTHILHELGDGPRLDANTAIWRARGRDAATSAEGNLG